MTSSEEAVTRVADVSGPRIASSRLAVAAACTAVLLGVACSPLKESRSRYGDAPPAATKVARTQFPVAPPPFSEGMFPCSECHSPTDKVDRTPRRVGFHDDIVLRHDEKNRWCLDCHDATNRDRLHLADGRLVRFTESYRLCGQCHGPTLRDWEAGEHGKRTGSWSGAKQYLLCPSCHSPHSPRFKPLEPKKPPLRQEAIR